MDSTIARLCVAASRDVYDHASIETDRAHVLIRTVPCPAVVGAVTNQLASITVVAFRGTKGIRDFITDAEFFRIPFFVCAGDPEPAGAVHAGFLMGVRPVMDAVADSIRSAGGSKVFLTGHSLGAAQAQLAAIILERRGIRVDGVYTFGSPRLGDSAWRDAWGRAGMASYGQSESGAPTLASYSSVIPLAARTYRFVNDLDIVPRLPGWLEGFRHVGQCEYLDSSCMPPGVPLVTNPHFWFMALSDALGVWRDYRIRHELSSLEDHHIDCYVQSVNQLT
jgi:predicted lipase